MITFLDISCSLRNARFGAGSEKLVKEIKELKDELELKKYLEQQTKICSEDFFLAGRKNDLPFDKLYQNLYQG
jgi:hypothetical protein